LDGVKNDFLQEFAQTKDITGNKVAKIYDKNVKKAMEKVIGVNSDTANKYRAMIKERGRLKKNATNINDETIEQHNKDVEVINTQTQWRDRLNKKINNNQELVEHVYNELYGKVLEELTFNTEQELNETETKKYLSKIIGEQRAEFIKKQIRLKTQLKKIQKAQKDSKENKKETEEINKKIIKEKDDINNNINEVARTKEEVEKLKIEINDSNIDELTRQSLLSEIKSLNDILEKLDTVDKDDTLYLKNIIATYTNLREQIKTKLATALVTNGEDGNKRIKTKELKKETKETEQTQKEKLLKESIDMFNELMDGTDINIIPETDEAVDYGMTLSEKQSFNEKFVLFLTKTFSVWNDDYNKHVNTDCQYHLDFYKFLKNLLEDKIHSEILKDMYNGVFYDFATNVVGLNVPQVTNIIKNILNADFNGDLAKTTVNEATIEESSNEREYKESPTRQSTSKEDSQRMMEIRDAEYNGKKNTDPSISIAYNEREAIKIIIKDENGNENLLYNETHNITKGTNIDKTNIGDRITLKVIDDNSIKITLPNDKTTTWGDLKINLKNNPKELKKYTPIVITNQDGDVLGFLHDQTWIEKKSQHLAKDVDVEQEINNINRIRKYVIDNNSVETEIISISNGIVNKDKNNSMKYLNDKNPNNKEGGIRIAVYDGSDVKVNEKQIVTNILDNKILQSIRPKGSILILVPNSTKNAYHWEFAKLGIMANHTNNVSNTLFNIMMHMMNGTHIIDEEPFKKMLESNFYLRHPSFETLDTGDKIDDKYFINYTKKGILEFAHVDNSIKNSWKIYRIDMKTGEMYFVERKLKNGKPVISKPNPIESVENKINTFKTFKSIIEKSRFNVNINYLGGKYSLPIFVEGVGLQLKDYEDYEDYVKEYIITDLIEKTIEGKDGNISYSYTIQPVVKFDSSFISSSSSSKEMKKDDETDKVITDQETQNSKNATSISNENILSKLVNDIEEDNYEDEEKEDYEEYEEYDDEERETDEAMDWSEESIDKLKNITQTEETQIDYQIEQTIISGLNFKISNAIIDKTIKNKNDFNKYFDNLLEQYRSEKAIYENIIQNYNKENFEIFRNTNEGKQILKSYRKYNYEEIKQRLEAVNSVLNNTRYYMNKLMSNINDTIDNVETQLIELENVENVRKPQWDIGINEKDVMLKSSLKMKSLLSSIPIAKFKYKDDEIVLKNGKPIIIYKKDLLGNKQVEDSRTITQSIHNLLIDYSYISEEIKFSKFIDLLKQSGDASLYLFVLKLENQDDNTKASFINTMSVQETNENIIMFKTEYKPVWDEEHRSYKMGPNNQPVKELVNIAVTIKSSNKTQIGNIEKKFIINAKSNINSIFLKKQGDKIILDYDVLNEYDTKFRERTITHKDILNLINLFNPEFTKSDYNRLFNNKNILGTFFNKWKIKNPSQLLDKNDVIHYMIKDMMTLGKNVDVSIINPLFNTNKSLLKAFAKLQLSILGRYGTSTYKNLNGDTVRSVTNNTALSKRIGELKNKEDDSLLKLLSSNESVMTGEIKNTGLYKSFWIAELNAGNTSLNIGIQGGMKKMSKFANGKMKLDMNDNELLLYQLLSFINNNNKSFLFSPLSFSDKKTSEFLSAPRLDINYKIYSNYGLPSYRKQDGMLDIRKSNKIQDIITQYLLLPEIHRINKHIEAVYNGKINEDNTSKNELLGGYLFFFIPELNELSSIRDKYGKIVLNDETREIIYDVVYNKISKEIEDNYKIMLDNLYKKNGKKERLKMLPQRILDKMYGYSDNMDIKEYLKFLAVDFTLNHQIATAEYVKIGGSFFSSTYKAKHNDIFNKDYIITENDEQITDDGKTILLDSNKKYFIDLITEHSEHLLNKVDDTIKEYTKRQAKDIAPRIDGYWQDKQGRNFTKYIQLYVSEPASSFYEKEYNKLGIKGYERVEGADAQEWSSIKEYIITAHAFSNISDEVYEEMMEHIDNVQKKNRDIIARMEKEGATHKQILDAIELIKIPEHLKKELIFTSTKPVTVSHKFDSNLGREVTSYIKVSTFPLIADIFENSEMKDLMKQIEYLESKNQTSVRVAMNSGVKEGNKNVQEIWSLDNKNKKYKSNIDNISKLIGEILDRKDTGIQLEEPLEEVKTQIRIVSQANKLLFSGLTTGFKTKDGSMEGFEYNGEIMSAKNLKIIKENIKKEIVNREKKNLLDQLELIDRGDEGYVLKNNTLKERKKFIHNLYNIINKEMTSRNYTEIDKMMVEIINDREFKIPLDFTAKSSNIEALLLSIITNRIINIKVPGKNYINVAGNGLMSINRNSDMVFTDKYDGDRLKYVEFQNKTDEDGEIQEKVQYAQCFMPFNFTDQNGKLLNINDFLKEGKDGKKYIDTSKMDEDLFKHIGLRIPNQGHSSMLILEVVGFLPEYMESTIILPPEITKQMGSDNDYDHIFVYSNATNYSLNEEQTKQIKDEIKKEYYYENFKGDESYQLLKDEYEELAIKYSDKNIKIIEDSLSNDDKILLKEVSEKGQDELYKVHSSNKSDLNENEIKVKEILNNYYKQWNVRKKEQSERIKQIKNDLSDIRIKEYNKKLKSEIRKSIKEQGKLKKVNYDTNLKNNKNISQLQNAYIDIFHSVLSHPKVARKMLKLLDLPYLGDESSKLRAVMEQGEHINPLSNIYSNEIYRTNQMGKIGVSIESLASTFLAIIEDKNLKFYDDYIEDNPIKINVGKKDPIIITGIGRATSTTENGIELTNAQIIQMLQNESVDNAKELNLSGIDYNAITAPIYNVFAMMKDQNGNGFSMEQISRIMQQETIIEFVLAMANKKDITNDFTKSNPRNIFLTLAENFAKKAKISVKEMSNFDFIFEDSEYLFNNIKQSSNKEETQEYYKYQASMALKFAQIYEVYIQPTSSLIINVAGLDSTSIGKSFIEYINKFKRITNSIENSPFENVNNIFEFEGKTTELGQILNEVYDIPNQIYLSDNIIGKYIFTQNSYIFKNLKTLLEDNYGVNTSYEDNSNAIWTGFKQYIYSMVFERSFKTDSQSERKRLLYGEDSIAIRTLNYSNKKWFKNNSLLSNMKIDFNENTVEQSNDKWTTEGINAMYLEHDSYTKDLNSDYQSVLSFVKLYHKTLDKYKSQKSNIELQKQVQYLEDIVKYTILEGGVQNSHNWVKYLHPVLLEEFGILEELRNFQTGFEVDYDYKNISKQILLNNPKLIKSVSVDLKTNDILLSSLIIKKDENQKKLNEIIKITMNVEEFETNMAQYSDLTEEDQLRTDIGKYDIFKYYDKDKKKFLFFEKIITNDPHTFTWIRTNKLGSTGLGIIEMSSDPITTILTEEMDLGVEHVINTTKPLKPIKENQQQTIVDNFINKPSYETIKSTLYKLSNKNDISKFITTLLLSNEKLFKDGVYINQKVGSRALTSYKDDKTTLDIMTFNLDRVMELTKNNKESVEMFEELLQHEMLHVIFRDFTKNFQKGLLNEEQIELYYELDRIRKESYVKFAEQNPELYEQYKKEKLEKENNKRTVYSQEVVESFIPLESVNEMLSYAWTNKNFQNNMNSFKINNQKGFEKLLSKMKDILISIAKSLGIKDNNTGLGQMIEKSVLFYSNMIIEDSQIQKTKELGNKIKQDNIRQLSKKELDNIHNEQSYRIVDDLFVDVIYLDNEVYSLEGENITDLQSDEMLNKIKEQYELQKIEFDEKVQKGNKQPIVNRTEIGNVVIPFKANEFSKMKEYAKKNNAIYSLRNGNKVNINGIDFGNPFGLIDRREQGTIKQFKTTKEAIQAYRDWLTTDKYDISKSMNHTGGATGYDTFIKNLGSEFKTNDYTVAFYDKLSIKEKEKLNEEYLKVVKFLKRGVISENLYSGKLVRRDMLQADKADKIIAVTELVKSGIKGRKGYLNKTAYSIPEGGTGYAVSRGIMSNKDVYVYNQSNKYGNDIGWYKWNTFENDFIKSEAPILSGNFAGIGSREMTEIGKNAIKKVYDESKKLQQRKQQILKAIESGELKGKEIVYYKELGEPSHANVLDELINNRQPKEIKTDTSQEEINKSVELNIQMLKGKPITDFTIEEQKLIDILTPNEKEQLKIDLQYDNAIDYKELGFSDNELKEGEDLINKCK